MALGEYNPTPKPQHKRLKPTAKERGCITEAVYQAASERASGRCEACGWRVGSRDPSGRKWRLEAAHLVRRWNVESETTAQDIAMLCGPSVNTGTCHNIVDYTKRGREWAPEYRQYLLGQRPDKPILKREEQSWKSK